jgi:RND family efflux transporter MFP subunit
MRRALFLLLLTTAPALAQMGPANVIVAPLERRDVPVTQPLVASVEPVTRTTLATEVGGIVAERFFDEGQRVEKGALLARGLTDMAQAQRDAQDAAMQSAAARLEQAKAVAAAATRDRTRLEKLRSTDGSSEKELSDAITAEEVAAAVINTRSAEVAEEKAELARLDLALKKAEARSPLHGVVVKRYVEVGQWMEIGDPVADVVQLDPLFVRVNVPESVISRIKIGDPATVTFDALGIGTSLTGKIEQIIPAADPSSRTFPVKILLPNPDFKIWPGFFARAMITSRSQGSSFLVPRDAVVTSGNQHRVIAARGGKAVAVPVTIGPGAGDKVSVTGELNDSDVVVVRGNESLRGGEDLIVQNPPATAPTTKPTTTQTAHGT